MANHEPDGTREQIKIFLQSQLLLVQGLVFFSSFEIPKNLLKKVNKPEMTLTIIICYIFLVLYVG